MANIPKILSRVFNCHRSIVSLLGLVSLDYIRYDFHIMYPAILKQNEQMTEILNTIQQDLLWNIKSNNKLTRVNDSYIFSQIRHKTDCITSAAIAAPPSEAETSYKNEQTYHKLPKQISSLRSLVDG